MARAVISVVSPLDGMWVEQQGCTEFWTVRRNWSLGLIIDGVLHIITIYAGWMFNRASIPDWFSGLVSKDDLGCKSTAVHDAFYNGGGDLLGGYSLDEFEPSCVPYRRFTREESDLILYLVAVADGGNARKAFVAWETVRQFARCW